LEWENLIPLNCKIFGFTSAEVISSIMVQFEIVIFLPFDNEILLPPGHPVTAKQYLKALDGYQYQAWNFSDRDNIAQAEEITMH
jgi:hypothetical protein